MPRKYEQRPGETGRSYAAFLVYLRQGSKRTLSETYRQVGGNRTSFNRWSKEFEWKARAIDYDAHLVEQEMKIREAKFQAAAVDWTEREREQREAEWAAAQLALKAVREYLSREVIIKSPRDAALLLDVASKVGRLATGMATEHKEVQNQVSGSVSIDINVALEKAYGVTSAMLVLPEGEKLVSGQSVTLKEGF